MARIVVESWSPEYGAPLDPDEALAPAEGSVDETVETTDWAPRDGNDDGGAPWRPVAGEAVPRSAGVLGITGEPTEVTGDGSDDVVLRLDTGGSGACARTLVLDLAAAAIAYDEQGCDRRVEPHRGPTGLLVTEAVYEPGDPHCCPSAFRRTVLTYAGDGAWDVVSEETSAS